MLTIEKFNEIPAGEVFARGTVSDNESGINMINSNKLLRWIAKKGDGYDWAIYCHWDFHSEEYIAESGNKVGSEKNIRHLIPCSDEVFKLYRY